jgi:hypothetical protein
MLKKILSFAIRAIATLFAGLGIGSLLYEIGIGNDMSISVAVVIWIIGGLYTLGTINRPFKLIILDSAGNIVNEKVRDIDRKKMEDKMIRLKMLKDSGILADVEYNTELNKIKEAYLRN